MTRTNSILNQKKSFIFFLIYLISTILVNYYANAFGAELGGASDEPAHFLTVLMLKKYFLDFFPDNPLLFFQDFYNHYPKIGLGNWPPIFYIFASFWAMIIGTSISKLMFFQCLIVTLELFSLFLILNRFIKSLVAFIIPLSLFFCFEWQQQLALFMIDHSISLLILISINFLIQYWLDNSTRALSYLSLVISLGCLTKGNFVFCFIWIPFLFLRLSTKLELRKLKNYFFILPPLLLSLIWYMLAVKYTISASVSAEPMLQYAGETLKIIFISIKNQLSLILTLTLLVSLILDFTKYPDNAIKYADSNISNIRKISIICSSAFISYILLHIFFQSGQDPRHYTPLLPLSLLIIICLIKKIENRFPQFPSNFIAVLLFVIIIFQNNFIFYTKKLHGAENLVNYLNQHSSKSENIMIASDPFGQGALIVEFALKDSKYERFLKRSDKIISNSNWSITNYSKKYSNKNSLIKLLMNSDIEWIVLDHTVDLDFPEKHHFDLGKWLPKCNEYKLVKSFPYQNRYKFNLKGLDIYKRSQN